ncbi:unnamed protein product [Litomosoides sigmodontis]|uniref:Uncharacterized protein n=1 Tax=Litomosoides sigmodontis TaxID=42156 RepID=A0A3P6SEY1_LITSI|nr:unnamed protein product [Litomosoides sigmodontis]
MISTLTGKTSSNVDDNVTTDSNENENMDEFFDAKDSSFGETESDVYSDNVQFVINENTDYLNEHATFEMDDNLHELGLMLNCTLASDYNGANAARLNAHFFNDWTILLEKQAIELGFPDLEELLKSECMKDYVEQTSSINGIAIYGAVSKPSNEHILRRVADCRLNEDQRAEKRRVQRLMELKNPENERNFLEGKRRILQILLDLKADETEVDYQTIRDEYMKRYNISLNASEHQRLFMNKSALKNFWRAFYREVILINGCPIRVRLRSPNVKIPEEITDDLRLLANIDKIELPTFALEYRPTSSFMRERRTVECPKDIVVSLESTSKKPTMDWGEEAEEDGDKQLIDEKLYRSSVGSSDKNDVVAPSMAKAEGVSTDTNKIMGIQENGSNRTPITLSKLTSSIGDKYTGDEESADSSDSETRVSRKYRKKKSKGCVNTFNISSKSPEVIPRIQMADVNGFEKHLNNSGKDLTRMEQSARLMNGGENKQLGKRVPIAERSLQQSLNYFHPRHQFPSSYTGVNKNSARLIPELNKIPYGSYSVPNSLAGQCNSRQTEENTGSYRKPNESVQRPSSSRSRYNGQQTTMQHMEPYQPNLFQQYGQGYHGNCDTSIKIFPNSNEETVQLSKETQTDENWLETLLDEFGCHKSKKSPLKKLAEVIELIVDIRSPNPILLSALPQIVGSLYGAPIKPENDENYRRDWKEIIRDYCSAEILISPLPNGEEVLVKRKLYC